MNRTRFAIAIAIASLLVYLVLAKKHSNSPKALLARADHLAILYNWPRAIPLYVEAGNKFRATHSKDGELEARLGWIRAEAYQNPSTALTHEVGKDLRNPMVQANAGLMLRCLLAKAALEEEVNENSSRATWEKVQELATKLGNHRWQRRAQAELGIIEFLDGDVAAANQDLKSAVTSMFMHLDLGGAAYYTSIVGNGFVEAGQPRTGIKYCQIAIKTAYASKDMGFPFMAYEGEARGLIALHQEKEAKQVLTEAIRKAQAENSFAAEAQLLVVQGEEDIAANRTRAIQELQHTTDFCSQHGFEHVLAWATFELATAYKDEGNLADGARFAALAERRTETLEDKYHLPEDFALMAGLAAKADQARKADRLYSRAEDVTQGLLVSLPSRQVESSLIATLSNVYLGHFQLAALELKNVSKAFDILESARGRAIADQLRSGKPIERPRNQETEAAQKEISQLQIQLLHATLPRERRSLLERLFRADQMLGPEGETETPMQMASLRGTPVDLRDIQRSLNSREAILEYVLDTPQSFCLYITRHRAGVATLPAGREEIDRLVADYRRQVLTRTNDIPASRELYSALVNPLPPYALKPSLIVVPDGQLNLIPFDALTDNEGRYVLATHVVSYAPSAAVLNLIENSRGKNPAPIIFLGLGGVQYQAINTAEGLTSNSQSTTALSDPFGLKAHPLPDLPHSADEVNSAGKIFGSSSVLLVGTEATEAAFKAEPLSRFMIIHIAAHGIANPRYPDRAALVLGPDPAHRDDGLLQAREIRELHLDADLVTLSACDTGIGRLDGEEGIENIERAFLYAGAKSVLASLWAASDVYTTDLMDRFYRNLRAGQDEGEALRHAKLDLLKQFKGQAVPFYWAGLTLVGDSFMALHSR
ncbi:MAG: CHAT domain-containing protein [Acidobacteria bacterium]|nr:MAG: CHAT domain-containing protein [Acidobacteriota bacterium]